VKVMALKEVFHFVSTQVREALKQVEAYLEQVAADLRPLFAELVDRALGER
jgi:hypothetical protein